jgi:hypothetical protein
MFIFWDGYLRRTASVGAAAGPPMCAQARAAGVTFHQWMDRRVCRILQYEERRGRPST